METEKTAPPLDNPETPVVESKPSMLKPLLIGMAVLVVIAAIAGGAYALGMRSLQTATPSTQVTPTETVESVQVSPTTTQETSYPDSSIVPITAYTVAFARFNSTLLLRYNNHVYNGQDEYGNPTESPSSPQSPPVTWYGLIDPPQGAQHVDAFDEVFGMKSLPGTNSFLFVMRFTVPDGNTTKGIYPVYYYDSTQKNPLKTLATFTVTGTHSFDVPKLISISPDNKYASFNMHVCWNCGGSKPETLLMNIATGTSKRIGKTSYFAWKTNGVYEYKEYIAQPCPTPTGGGDFMGGECPTDPSTLPMKTGTMQ